MMYAIVYYTTCGLIGDNKAEPLQRLRVVSFDKSLDLQWNLVPLFILSFQRRENTNLRGRKFDLCIGLIRKLVDHENGEDLQLHQSDES